MFRRYQKPSLASANDYANDVKKEVGVFQAMKAGLTKTSPKTGLSARDKEFAVAQLMSGAIADADIIDVFAAAGLKTPEISVLSDEFPSEI